MALDHHPLPLTCWPSLNCHCPPLPSEVWAFSQILYAYEKKIFFYNINLEMDESFVHACYADMESFEFAFCYPEDVLLLLYLCPFYLENVLVLIVVAISISTHELK